MNGFSGFRYGQQEGVWNIGGKTQGFPLGRGVSSRELICNSPLAKSVMRLMAVNVIGPHGPQPTFTNVKDEKDRKKLLEFWSDWSLNPTVGGKITWSQMLRTMQRTMFLDGRVFAVLRRNLDYEYGFAVMPLPRYWLALTGQGMTLEKIVINGVQMDAIGGVVRGASGRIKGYLFKADTRPQAVERANAYGMFLGSGIYGHDVVMDRVFIPEKDVCDFYVPTEVGDYGGIPENTAMLDTLYGIAKLDSAMIQVMNLSTKKMGFISAAVEAPEYKEIEGEEDEDSLVAVPTELNSGEIEYLPQGHSFQAFDPQTPNADMALYRQELARNAVAAEGVDYASASGDLSDVNFSSIRQGVLTARDSYRLYQRDMERTICAPILRRLLEASAMHPDFPKIRKESLEAAMKSPWRHRSWAWVDPMKDAMASKKLLEIGVTSPQEICQSLGKEYEDVVSEIADAYEILKRHKLTPQQVLELAGVPEKDDTMEGSDTDSKEPKAGKSADGSQNKQNKPKS